MSVAEQFCDVNEWIQQNVRNVLDESDAILHAKYQLIYTVGNQLPIDGGELRWAVAQAVMKRVPEHMRRLYQIHGADKIEFDERHLQSRHVYGADRVTFRPDVFPPCRLLHETMFDELRKVLIIDFLEGNMDFPFPELQVKIRDDVRALLSQKQINKDTLERVLEGFAAQHRNAFMILSGLLRFEVLRMILTKRWRVNYGVNPKGPRKMAVPFKAKDMAAEMTEFGHADVAISFTLMSYYYSGERLARLLSRFSTKK